MIWTAEVPGFGKSSPILSRDRVFVSTSYQDRVGQRLADGLGEVCAVLAVVFLREIPAPTFAAGAGLVLTGVYITGRR